MDKRREKQTNEHRWLDDVQALLIVTSFAALGVLKFSHAGLLTGGTAGACISDTVCHWY